MISRRMALALLGIGTVSVVAGSNLISQAAQSKVFKSSSGIAINGYDPVAYFTERKPVKGSSKHKTNWNGATWQFSSADNLALFKSNPNRYAPQYGGYCAYAVSYGSTARTVPQAWSIKNGKLYLNYSLGIRNKWEADSKTYISKANRNWPGVLN